MPATLNDILQSHRTGRAFVMGILNVTPDSFSDGGEFLTPAAALTQARALVMDGAEIIDVGAESTRPGASRVAPADQIARLGEVLPGVVATGACVSVDTTRSEVARFALDAGAKIVNDVSAGLDDPDLLPLVADRGAAMVLMHMRGQPATMQEDVQYQDVVAEVRDFLAERLTAAQRAGVDRERCIVDPGIGFGKRLEHNLALLGGVDELLTLDRPVLIGASRKRFIGELTGEDEPAQRVSGSVAAHLAAWRGGATLFRVHDVRPFVSALQVARAVAAARSDRDG